MAGCAGSKLVVPAVEGVLVDVDRIERGVRDWFVGFVLAKVGGVAVVLERGSEWRRHLAAAERGPIDVAEPRLALDVLDAEPEVPEPLARLRVQQLGDEVDGALAKCLFRVVHLERDYSLEDGHLRLRGERGCAREHLVDEHAERPVVDRLVLPRVPDHLWRHVFGRSADGEGVLADLLGQAKVHHFDVPFLVDDEVLGLEVAVDDVARVEVLEGDDDARGVKLAHGVGEDAIVPQEREELPPGQKLKQHVHGVRVLVGPEERVHKLVVDLLQHALFVQHVLLLLEPHDEVFAHRLEGVVLAAVAQVRHELHRPERAHPELLDHRIVVEVDAVLDAVSKGARLDGRAVRGCLVLEDDAQRAHLRLERGARKGEELEVRARVHVCRRRVLVEQTSLAEEVACGQARNLHRLPLRHPAPNHRGRGTRRGLLL
mmetsp:Transcript_26704/g.87562  ORF Transcript_26704/g.87562 Transcript_26704/m.87562 type:complete len:430 (-) Transcript_26704:798-2087(-)